jgi:hypothetical protein
MSQHRSRRAPVALRSLVAALAALVLSLAPAGAGDKPGKKAAELAGKLVCIGCHLEKEYAAEAQCTLHAKHAQGFLADDGTLHTLLDNGRGHVLVTDRKLGGTPLKLEAYAFPKAQVLEVIRFSRKDGERWVRYDYCKNCGFEPGDNRGKDLCEDCEK